MPLGFVTQVPYPGSSGRTPTGALQFQDDWPGLFVRGDDAIPLMFCINELRERLADCADSRVQVQLERLSAYSEIISQDVIVK